MQAAADTPYVAATDLAEQLVLTGMPFREAHAIVGALVRDSLERQVPLADLVAAHPAFERGRPRAARAGRVGRAPHDARAAPAPAPSPRSSTASAPASPPTGSALDG